MTLTEWVMKTSQLTRDKDTAFSTIMVDMAKFSDVQLLTTEQRDQLFRDNGGESTRPRFVPACHDLGTINDIAPEISVSG